MENNYIVFIEYDTKNEAKISPIKYSLTKIIINSINNINSTFYYYYNSNIEKINTKKLLEIISNSNEKIIPLSSSEPVISFIIITSNNSNYVINCNSISDKPTKPIDKNIKNLKSKLLFLVSKIYKKEKSADKSRQNTPIVLETKPVTPATTKQEVSNPQKVRLSVVSLPPINR